MKEDEVGKILIVKFGGIGDVFLSTIVIDSLRAFFPHATLDYLVAGAGREAIVHDPRINALIVLDKKEMHPVSVILDVRRRRYDVVIDLFGNPAHSGRQA